jgi:hypothetical protein
MKADPQPSDLAARQRRSKLFGRAIIIGLGLLLLAYVAQLSAMVRR